jgi:hypothetical protein
MTLLSVVKDVCAAVGVAIPQSVFANITGNRTMLEMVALANEMAQRISYDARDWQAFLKSRTLTGDGVPAAFDMPDDFKRMMLTGNVWRSTSTQQPMTYIADYEEWLNRRAGGETASHGEWTRVGNQILVYPIMPTGVTAYYPYMHKNCVRLGAGGVGDTFVADNDVYGLDERILKLGMIWQWKANKGAAYAEDMGTFGDAIAKYMGNDKPGPILIGRLTKSQTIKQSFPYTLPS